MATTTATSSERAARIAEAERAALRTATEVLGTGRTTLEVLERQDETLHSAEQNLESNAYIIDKSKRALRNMTWSGWLYNIVTPRPTEPQALAGTASGTRTASGGGSSTPGTAQSLQQQQADRSALGLSQSVNMSNPSDATMLEVSRSLDELHRIGVTMGETLEGQSATLDRVSDKTEKVTSSTLEVALRSAQLVSNSRGTRGELVGEFQFQSTTGGKEYLAVDGETLVMSAVPDLASVFRVYVKENLIFGIQSSKTLRFLSTGTLVAISAFAPDFTKHTECHVDLNAESTGLFFMSYNWGSGGWLKYIDVNSGFYISSGPNDKKRIIMFKVIRVSHPVA